VINLQSIIHLTFLQVYRNWQ